MGYFRHHAIIVSSYEKKSIDYAHAKAVELFSKTVTNIVESYVNLFYTFVIGPDGSKEGWETSEGGDVNRENYIDWMKQQIDEESEDGYYFQYAHFFYGDDNDESGVLANN